jgi:hypothetical protein
MRWGHHDATSTFQYRVAAIALRDGRVLLCRDNLNGPWYTPGGRVELASLPKPHVRQIIHRDAAG